MNETNTMEFVVKLLGEAWEHRRKRQRLVAVGLMLVAVAVAAGLLLGRSAHAPGQAVGAGYQAAPSSSVLAYHGIGYPLSEGSMPISMCRAAAPQSSACESINFVLVLKHPATSAVVSFGGLVVKLNRSKIKPGTTMRSGLKLRTGAVFDGNMPTVTLIRTKARAVSGVRPAIGHSGYATFLALISYADGNRVSTKFRQYLRRGWL
jgi:hypothetical protein